MNKNKSILLCSLMATDSFVLLYRRDQRHQWLRSGLPQRPLISHSRFVQRLFLENIGRRHHTGKLIPITYKPAHYFKTILSSSPSAPTYVILSVGRLFPLRLCQYSAVEL